MPDIKISGTNNVFKPLEKPGYSIYFNTRIDEKTNEKKYKIIYKNDKNDKDDKDDSDITISNSVIFNTIYSHEINENDIPLVEYYNLLIENKNNPANIQQEPSVVTPPDIPYLIPEASEQPVQAISSTPLSNEFVPYTHINTTFTSTLDTPPSPPSRPPPSPPSPPSRPPPSPPSPSRPPPSRSSFKISYTPFNSIKTFFSEIITKWFGGRIENSDIILGIATETETGNENNNLIKSEYRNRYPPDYKGEISKIHMKNNDDSNLDFSYELKAIRERASAWDEYINKNIPDPDKNNILRTHREKHNSLRDYFKNVTGDENITLYNNYFNAQIWMRDNAKYNEQYYQYDLVVYRDKLLTDLFMNNLYSKQPPIVIPQNLPEDRLDFLDADQEKYYFNSVNQYGYPIYRAYYLNNQLYQYFIDKLSKPTSLQRTRSIGGMFGKKFTLDGKPLDTEAAWIRQAIDMKNGTANFQPSSFQVDLYSGNSSLSPAISTETQSQNTIKCAWDCKDKQITRFNGYYDMNYDRIKKDIFEYNENKNMNIKFFIFSIEDIQAQVVDRQVTIIILKTSDNKIDPIIVTSPEAFLQDIKDKLENKIIAKISTTTDVSDTYILFNVDIIGNIKDAKIYKEEDKYKYDFVNLNNDLKKIIEYYNTISNLPYFRTYREIKKQLTLFKETYEQTPHVENLLISIYKEELKLRISICDNIIVSSGIDNNIEKNIKKYKDLLDYTYKNIDNYPDKKDYFERINKCVPLLIDRVRYYGENFIY
jgi:hypothetical protein